MKQILKLIPAVLFVSLINFLPENLSAYTQDDLEASLKYYYKVSSSQNLSPNDRLAILLKIKSKYKGKNLDFTELENAISLQEKQRKKTIRKEEPFKEKSRKPPISSVKKITVDDLGDSLNVEIISDKPKSSNSFLLKDPDPLVAPKIILDLYGVTVDFTKEEKEIFVKSETIEKVKAGQFEKEPLIVRVVVFLKKPANYQIKEKDSGFSIVVKKENSEIKKETPPPSPAVAVETSKRDIRVESPVIKRTGYKIEPGDILTVNIYPAEELSREVVVEPGGEITLPLVGVLNAKGETVEKLSEKLKKLYSKYISSPEVSVIVKQYAKRRIFITGEVKSTGGFPYRENLRLIELISQAGGFTEKANRRGIKIYRGEGASKKTFIVDIDEIIKTGDFSKDFLLEPADMVEVSVGAKKISVLGDVRHPGNYDFRENLKLLEAISLAGGFSETAKISSVSILRKEGDKTKFIAVNVDEILKGKKADIELKVDDTIYLPKKTISSANWWLQNVMPWLSLLSLILVIRAGI